MPGGVGDAGRRIQMRCRLCSLEPTASDCTIWMCDGRRPRSQETKQWGCGVEGEARASDDDDKNNKWK